MKNSDIFFDIILPFQNFLSYFNRKKLRRIIILSFFEYMLNVQIENLHLIRFLCVNTHKNVCVSTLDLASENNH
jgi:hypothetical protein